MQLHQLSSNLKDSKRIGRGGRRGTYSGRGIKGQRSRSGARIRPEIRDLIKRIPKARGYEFKSHIRRPITITLRSLENASVNGDLVNLSYLRAQRLIKHSDSMVKIVATGKLTKKITVKNCKATKGAVAAIKAAGGTIVA